jgi:uncharacterized phiE125 gp8 family phage protein
MRYEVVTAPAGTVLTLAELKAHLRIDSVSTEDGVLGEYLAAATERAENETGQCLLPRSLRAVGESFPSQRYLDLERGPVRAITSVQYLDAAGTLQTMASTDYTLDASFYPYAARVCLVNGKDWPAATDGPRAVRVTYDAGFANAASIPRAFLQAIRFLAGHFYENRQEAVTGTIASQVPQAFEHLLTAHQSFYFR